MRCYEDCLYKSPWGECCLTVCYQSGASIYSDTTIGVSNKEGERRIKSEAIKEFAERLKKEKMHDGWIWGEIVEVDDIDNLVKEMTEQSNG